MSYGGYKNCKMFYFIKIPFATICDSLRENSRFAKIFHNAVRTPKFVLAKKLIPYLNNFWSRNGIFVPLVYILNEFGSLKVAVSVLLKDGLFLKLLH